MPDSSIAAQECKASKCEQRLIEQYPGRDTNLGPLKILRALPIKGKRMVGPWCFLDRYGPLTFREGKPMDVAPHPHIGLQTVTWLLSGEILHNDSLGCEGLLRPGGVNVMTSGDGIAHAEETPRVNSAILDGVQLWVALPDAHRTTAPVFQAIQCFTPRECDEKQEPYPGPALPTIGGAFQEYLLRFSWPLSFVCLDASVSSKAWSKYQRQGALVKLLSVVLSGGLAVAWAFLATRRLIPHMAILGLVHVVVTMKMGAVIARSSRNSFPKSFTRASDHCANWREGGAHHVSAVFPLHAFPLHAAT